LSPAQPAHKRQTRNTDGQFSNKVTPANPHVRALL
jgi:hypothetical protein